MRFEIGGRQVAGSFEGIMLGWVSHAPEILARTSVGRVAISDKVRLISTVSWTLGRLEATMFDIWSSVIDGLIPRHQSMISDNPFELWSGGMIGEIIVGPWTATELYIKYDSAVIEYVMPVTMHYASARPEYVFYDWQSNIHLGTSDTVVKMLIVCAMIKHGSRHLY